MSEETAPAEAVEDHDYDLDDPQYYLNRELSELAFQRRVLHEAIDERNPLLERVKFLSIFTSNLDEFFMKRVGGLKQQMAVDVTDTTPDGRTPEEQWEEIMQVTGPMFERQARCYREAVKPALADQGIYIVDHDDLETHEQQNLREYFERSILPTLTPLTFDPAHPFPFISNLSLSLAVLTRKTPDAEPKFSRIKIPGNRPRLVQVDDSHTYVPLEGIIAANLDLLFPDVEILDHSMFRVTRNAEVRRNEEVAEDLIDMIEEVLRERRFATVVRLELEEDTPERVRELLKEHLDVTEREIFERQGPLDYRDLMGLTDLDRPDLKLDSWTPQAHPRLLESQMKDEDRDIFETIQNRDMLVHHPYHSFSKTVHRFIDDAAHDPNVLAIKAAIYRTSRDSNVIQSLIEAARNGKQVAVMVELKARFDEENNLRWVKKLEEEGIHVAYGTPGYKTHTKTTLVVREEGDDVELYSHVGTGNYHSETAKTYVDIGLLTANKDIGQDLVKLFNFFTGHSMHDQYRDLLIAPGNMRREFEEMIRHEAQVARDGGEGRIVAKMNRLEDPGIVEELYEASIAGVDIDLFVRDICRLRPGLDGVSENVDVYSVVGRFLEHSRIWYFENDDPGFYIGSADWMTRNLDNRIEAVTPVENPELQEELWSILELNQADNRKCWEMNHDGTYDQRHPPDGGPVVNMQERLMGQARSAVQDPDQNVWPPNLPDER
ncbi:polyphosphate kinase 1 [Haloarchaeobius sp. DT45]|uniref:polyphosphate kinase 1 n=1 Tax=Haloarchaeobius sp. DT45 TaxID=3446116 RepID=UPI003F6BA9C9